MNVTFTSLSGGLLAVLYGDRSHGVHDVLVVRTIKDWYSITDSKADLQERPAGHGAFPPGRDWRQSGVYSVEGWFLGSSRGVLRQAKRDLGRLVGAGPIRVTVTDEDETTSRVVSVHHLAIPDDRGRNRFTFAIDLAAPDPRRYGPRQQARQDFGAMPGSNLIANPSFETGTAGWSAVVDGAGQELSQASGGFGGGQQGLLRVNAPASSVAVKRTVPVVASLTDRAHVRVRPSTTRPLSLTLNLFAGAVLVESHTLLEPVWCPAGTWTRLPLPIVLPVGATSLVFVVDSTGGLPWAAGDTLGVDAAMLGSSDDYADGDTLGWTWTGPRGASLSQSLERLLLVNDGTADSEPAFVIVGGMPDGFILDEIETQRSLRFNKPVPAGATTRIEPASGVVLVNGVPSFGLYRHQWPLVPAGTFRTYALTVGAQQRPVGLSLSGEFSSAWW